MQSTSNPEIFTASPRDSAKLAETLARAFKTDPGVSWMTRDDRLKMSALRDLFTFCLDIAYSEGEVHSTKDLKACALWFPPGKGLLDVSPENFEALGPRILRWTTEARVDRFNEVIQSFVENRPSIPHGYLEYIAVDPNYQGRGLGSGLLKYKLKKFDETRIPTYLENSNPVNTSLYERHGFKVLKTKQFGSNGPVLTFMLRQPRCVK